MKKIVLFLLCMSMVIGIMGCSVIRPQESTGGATSDSTEPPVTTANPSQSTELTPPADDGGPEKTVAVSFQTERETVRADDQTVIFTKDVPTINLHAQDNPYVSAIVKDFQSFVASKQITDLCTDILSMANNNYQPGSSWNPYTVSQSYRASRVDEKILSISGYVYSNAGGPHPSHYLNSATYDLQTGKRLSLSDVIKDESGLESLAQMVLKSLSNRGEDVRLFDDYVSVVMDHFKPGSPNFGSWYFSETGLVIYFSVYEIAAYAAGDFVLEYSYEGLEDILLPAYIPNRTVSADGTLHAEVIQGRIPQNLSILAALFLSNDGLKVFINAEGEICNVSVESGYWTEDKSMFLVDQVLFTANRITGEDGVLIQSVLPEKAPNLRISYETKDGRFSRYLALNYADGTVKLLLGAE